MKSSCISVCGISDPVAIDRWIGELSSSYNLSFDKLGITRAKTDTRELYSRTHYEPLPFKFDEQTEESAFRLTAEKNNHITEENSSIKLF
jgi:hypothetical protein